jgi:NHLM bacteriocin system ABC transporter ATP-binding protein
MTAMPDTSFPHSPNDADGPDTAPRRAEANTPILLAGPGQGVSVVAGAVDVFAVRLQEGTPLGARHPVYRAYRDDVVAGLPPEAGIGFLIVGGLGALVRDVSVDGILRDPAWADPIERHVASMLHALDRHRPSARAKVMDPGELVGVGAGVTIAGPDRRVSWLEETGSRSLALLGAQDVSAPCVPITATAWAETVEDGEVSLRRTADLIDTDMLAQAFRAFQGIYVRLLVRQLADLAAADEARLDRRTKAEAASLNASMQVIAATLDPSRDAAARSHQHADPYAQAFATVMEALAVPPAGRRPPSADDDADPIDALARAHGVRTRKVLLRDRWWQHDGGPMIGHLSDGGGPVALLPRRRGGYAMLEPGADREIPIDRKQAQRLSAEAISPYRPLPADAKRLPDLIRFILPTIRDDLRRIAMIGFLGGLLAALTPMLTGYLIESVLPRAALDQHLQIMLALTLIGLGAGAFEVIKVTALMRIEGRADLSVQAGLFDRLLRLPTKFYRRYTTGDLTDRVLGIQTIRQTVTGTTLASILGLLFSFFSLAVLFIYNWRLALVAICIVLTASVLVALLGRRQLVQERARMALQGRAEGFVLQMISAVAKLRTAGAEKRAYAQWATRYAAQKRRYVAAQSVANTQEILQSVLPILAAAVIFAAAAAFLESAARDQQLYGLLGPVGDDLAEPMSPGDFVAFNAAFGQFLLAMTTLVTALTRVLAVIPIFERLRPILEEPAEGQDGTDAARRTVATLKGGIEVNHVRFRYAPAAKPVLDDLSLSIAPNEFVAIVGPSGSGKSTLVRLLLGFEVPESGEILFDDAPLHSLDLASLRRQVQVVLQNSRLSGGSLFTNIAGSRKLGEEAVMQAVRQAGLEADIDALPMGLHTVITEGVSTFSGGQQQRIMIARALAQQPAVLVMDEPTSALDNATQDIVMNSLTHINATRILIAHRLSTVRHVDRIFVMEGGRLVESGRFDELMEKGGLFTKMAKRQQL